MKFSSLLTIVLCFASFMFACSGGGEGTAHESGDGDRSGDGDTGGDGDVGSGDGDMPTGDGDMSGGDGDSEPVTGDGDLIDCNTGDLTIGCGDGDGDFVPPPGDGDGDTPIGDGDGDAAESSAAEICAIQIACDLQAVDQAGCVELFDLFLPPAQQTTCLACLDATPQDCDAVGACVFSSCSVTPAE